MKRVMAAAAALVLTPVAALAACSGKTTGSASTNGVATGTTYSLSFGPVTVQPGEEHTKCIIQRLGNPSAIHVGTIHNVLSTGSHHMIVYRSNETQEQTTPFDCIPFTDTLNPAKGSTLIVTQKHDDTLTLPEGVAFALEASQMIRIEVHYINPGSSPIDVTASASFITMDESRFKDEADFLFVGDPDITLPAHAKTTLGPIFFAVPAEYANAKFFAITGHEHQFGTNVTVATAANKDDPGTSVYDVPDWKWSEPKTVVSDPPFAIPRGAASASAASGTTPRTAR